MAEDGPGEPEDAPNVEEDTDRSDGAGNSAGCGADEEEPKDEVETKENYTVDFEREKFGVFSLGRLGWVVGDGREVNVASAESALLTCGAPDSLTPAHRSARQGKKIRERKTKKRASMRKKRFRTCSGVSYSRCQSLESSATRPQSGAARHRVGPCHRPLQLVPCSTGPPFPVSLLFHSPH